MIKSLHLHNFKCFEDISLQFGRLTMLSGLNGMGKSSILQSLLLMRQSYRQHMFPDKNRLILNGDLVNLGIVSDVLYEWAKEEIIGIDIYDDGKDIFDHNLELKTESVSTSKADVLHVTYPSDGNHHIFDTSLFTENFHYLQAERIGPRPTFPTSNYVVVEQRQIGIHGEFTPFFLCEHGAEDIPGKALIHSQGRSPSLLHQVEAWMAAISPGIRIELSSHTDMDIVQLNYSFEVGRQVSKPYRATNVGFGITYTLPILVAVLSSKPGSLLLLENPEAHLHPHGQVQIGQLLAQAASCGVQIILETHSDHILNGIRLAVHEGYTPPEDIRLYYFGRQIKEDMPFPEVTTPTIDRNGRIDHWPEGFFDEIEQSLGILLEPARE